MNALANELEYEIYDYFIHDRFHQDEDIKRLAALINYCGTSRFVGEILGYQNFNYAWIAKLCPWLEDEFLCDPIGSFENFVLLGELIDKYDRLFLGFVLEKGAEYGMTAA
jgi:hypothetical protein